MDEVIRQLDILVKGRGQRRQQFSKSLVFLRGTARDTSSGRRGYVATNADSAMVAIQIEGSLFLSECDAIMQDDEGRRRARKRRLRRVTTAIELGLQIPKRRRHDTDLMDAAMENLSRQLRPAIPNVLGMNPAHPRCIADYSDKSLRKYFHVNREELERIVSVFSGFDDTIRTRKGSAWPRETAVLCFLRRMMARGGTDYDDENFQQEFGRQQGCLSEIFTFMVVEFSRRFEYLIGTPELNRFAQALVVSADAIRAKMTAALGGVGSANAFGDIALMVDGMFASTPRPGGPWAWQRVMYSGHKKDHGYHFLALILANGLIAWFFGPSVGRNGDLVMLRESHLIPAATILFNQANILHGDEYHFSIYGDRIFPNVPPVLCRAHRINILSPPHHVAENQAANKPRTEIEHVFANLTNKVCPIVKNPNALKVRASPVTAIFKSAAILTNFVTCLRGNQTVKYFGVLAPSLEGYIGGEVLGAH